jgi:hypothetical protein
MSYDVQIRAPDGSVHVLPERWATMLAEDLVAFPSGYDRDAERSASAKLESRLTGDEDSPVEFGDDEIPVILKGLNAVLVGWNTSEAKALYKAFY